MRKSHTLSGWEIVFPNDTNHLGTMFGGKLMARMDIVASIAASKFCEMTVVTASLEAFDFKIPVKMGNRFETIAKVVYTGNTSMVVKADVYAEDPTTNVTNHCTTAFFNMVALDENEKPAPVPPILVETDEEKKDYALGEEIRKEALKRIGK
ncbi:acyl-CoA thioesterase [Spirochaetota bacterium]